MNTITARDLYDAMQQMTENERIKFFKLIVRSAFHQNDFTHDEVFGTIENAKLTTKEAAEYLEISLPTLRRYVQSKWLLPSETIGKNQLFAAKLLRQFKKQLSKKSQMML